MNIITVIPIARGIGKEHLTYFSAEHPLPGSIVDVPLRSRSIKAIVTAVESAKNRKAEIKNLPFGMKRMERIAATEFLLPAFMEAVHDIAEYYAATTGAVLSTLLPKPILESIETVLSRQPLSSVTPLYQKGIGDISAIQAHDEERFGAYKSLIREEFARKKSVLVILSGREEIRGLHTVLSKGIDQHTHILHTGLSKKETRATWKKIAEAEHPVLIISTGYFLSIPRSDIMTIIIEGESSRGFSVPSRPYIDLRIAAEIFSKKSGIRLIYGASVLRIETMWRIKEGDIAEFNVLKFRALSGAECTLADMRTTKAQITEKKAFTALGETLTHMITEAQEERESVFLLCSRKGLSPITVCGDCGQTVSCKNCGSPTVLYKKKTPVKDHIDETGFICRRCGEKSPSYTTCTRCSSWKLVPLGIGIETAERDLSHAFPDTDIFVMDKDHIKTHAQAETLIRKFTQRPGSILLGTELAIPYITTIPYSGVVSIDSLFAIPEFRMNEKIMNMLIGLRSATQKKMVVQTRRPDEKIFEYALRGNLSDFYREEIAERERFSYPPFHVFIKITLEGKKVQVRAKMEEAKKILQPFDLNIFESQSSASYAVHGLLVVPHRTWPDKNLLERLRSLSPEFAIRVDPESIL